MINEEQKLFIKRNADILNEIYSDKIADLLRGVLDETTNRDKMIDVINILRSWLLESSMLKKGEEIKKTTFI